MAARRAGPKGTYGRGATARAQRNEESGNGYEGDPWERQDGEADMAWVYFQTYRDMGPGKRTLRETAKAHNIGMSWCGQLSAQWEWTARAAAYDKMIDLVKRTADLEAIVKMRDRHINLSMLRQSLGARELQKFDAQSKTSPRTVLELAEANKLIEDGIRLERLNRGEPESVTEQRHELTVGEKRAKLRSLVESKEMQEHIEQMADAMLEGVSTVKPK